MNTLRSLSIFISRIPPGMLLLLIVGFASLSAFLVTSELERSKLALDDEKNRIENARKAMGTVVVAIKDLPEGKSITADMLEEKKIPIGTIPADALTSSAMAGGRVTKYGITVGQIVSQHDLAPVGITQGFESRLKPGKRAITFAVDTNSGVAGFINPESRVDVISMVGGGADTKVAPILSDIEIIAVGQMYHREPGGSQAVPVNSVTVAITPEDVQKLVKGVAASKLYLALRSEGDHIPIATVDVTSLYPSRVSPDESTTQIASKVPPPPLSGDVLPTTEFGDQPLEPQTPGAIGQLPTRPNHEIEVWSASSKQLIEVPSLH